LCATGRLRVERAAKIFRRKKTGKKASSSAAPGENIRPSRALIGTCSLPVIPLLFSETAEAMQSRNRFGSRSTFSPVKQENNRGKTLAEPTEVFHPLREGGSKLSLSDSEKKISGRGARSA
jgi:hypothetical protein